MAARKRAIQRYGDYALTWIALGWPTYPRHPISRPQLRDLPPFREMSRDVLSSLGGSKSSPANAWAPGAAGRKPVDL